MSLALKDTLFGIDAFRPRGDNWRPLDDHIQSLAEFADLAPAIPTLLRVFERFPRHDGHGVLWGVIHALEAIPGYEPALVEHVTRAPTDMGITMLQRLVNANIAKVGDIELAPLIEQLTPLAPPVDGTIDRNTTRSLDEILADIDRLQPDIVGDWRPALAFLDEIFDRDGDLSRAITPLLRLLDRAHSVDGCPITSPIIAGLEALPEFPDALVASLKTSPTRNGVTLLLRLQGLRGVATIDGVDLAAFAAELLSTAGT